MPFIQEALEFPQSDQVSLFEHLLSEYIGERYCCALQSGTAAIHLALILLGVERGDEVLCQSFTFSASANPIAYQGATPVFIDSEPDTWNMDPDLLRQAIADRMARGKKPKAIIVVHLYGMPAKMKEIVAIANEYEIPIIEDAAEALGSHIDGQRCGSFGELGILSFNGNKIITTSGGGALLSNNEAYITKARFLATQARDEAPWYQHSHIGYNYRMSNIVAGIGRGQMQVLNERVSARRANFEFYQSHLEPLGFTFLKEPPTFHSNRWLTTVLVPKHAKPSTLHAKPYWQLIYDSCNLHNIETRPLWKPMHLQPIFKDAPAYMNGTSESLFHQGLCLPSGSNLSQADLERVVEAISEAV